MGLFSRTSQPQPVEVGGRPLACHVCGHTMFRKRRALLNTALASFFELDWAERSAECCICDNCGHIHWFMKR